MLRKINTVVQTTRLSTNHRRQIGGSDNRWLNITGTVISPYAEVPDTGDFICETCTDRGTPMENCHRATLTLAVVGAPPVLDKGASKDVYINTS